MLIKIQSSVISQASVVVRRQHFQTTSPLKPWSRFLPYFTDSIYRQGEPILLFFVVFLSQSGKNSGCCGNLWLPLTYDGKKMKIGTYCYLIAALWEQKCSLSGPLPNVASFCFNRIIGLVTMATKRKNLQKKIIKNQPLRSYVGDKAETLQNCYQHWPLQNYCFLLSLLWLIWHLKFPLTYTGKSESWDLLLSHCRCFDKSFTEMFVEWSSVKHIMLVQSLQFDWLPWQPKA